MSAVISLISAGYIIVMVVGFIFLGLRALFRAIFIRRPKAKVHKVLVARARRDRLTAIERERRLRAVYPIAWVPRERMKVSFGRY